MDPRKEEMGKKNLARYFSIATNVEDLLVLWCFHSFSHVVTRSSVNLVAEGELANTGIRQHLKELDTAIHAEIGYKLSEKHVSLPGQSLPYIDNFENDIYLDGTCCKHWDPMELYSVKPEAKKTAGTFYKYLNT